MSAARRYPPEAAAPAARAEATAAGAIEEAAATAPPALPAFEAIYREQFAYVWHTLRRLGIPAGDLEDVAHDVFVVVHRRLGDFDPERPLRPWLFGIAYRVASEQRRRWRRRGEVLCDDLAESVAAEGADPEAARARRLLTLVLERLHLDERAVLVMHDVDGHAAPEIAAALGIPLNTVYSRLRRARRKAAAAAQRLAPGDRHE